ncbi:MAG: acyltransferase family protein [Lachnospiraceae bacterium]|nr:acyltransferase family protein [Lachnospiraceae bacterium]
MEKSERLSYIDMAKGIAIILVVAGHSTLVGFNLLTVITSFHMPLFFVISGLLFYYKNTKNEGFKSFARKRFFSMIIPYISFSVIYILFYLFQLKSSEIITPEYIHDAFLQTFSLYGISVLWFLPAIFFGEIIFYLLIKKLRLKVASVIIIVFALVPSFLRGRLDILIPDIITTDGLRFLRLFLVFLLRLPGAVAFLGTGYALGTLNDKLVKRNRPIKPFIEVLIGVLLIGVDICLALLNGRVDMHYVAYNNTLIFYLAAISASIGILLICKHLPNIRPLSFFGKNSLIVMLTHLDCLMVVSGLSFAWWMDSFISFAKYYMYILNFAIFMAVTEAVLIFLINNCLFFLIGKKKPVR